MGSALGSSPGVICQADSLWLCSSRMNLGIVGVIDAAETDCSLLDSVSHLPDSGFNGAFISIISLELLVQLGPFSAGAVQGIIELAQFFIIHGFSFWGDFKAFLELTGGFAIHTFF